MLNKPVSVLMVIVFLCMLLGCDKNDIEAPPTEHQSQTLALKDIRKLRMIDAHNGWAFTGNADSVNKVLRTADGGESWREVTPAGAQIGGSDNVSLQRESSAAFLPSGGALVAVPQKMNGKVTVYRTVDYGESWETSELVSAVFPKMSPQMISISFPDSRHGWILLLFDAAMGSSSAELFRTVDGGAAWSAVSATSFTCQPKGGLPLEGIKYGVMFKDVQTGWIVGTTHGDGVWLYVTHDGGQTWAPQAVPIPKGASAEGGSATSRLPVFFSAQEGIMPVEFRGTTLKMFYYQTRDGGQTWSPLSSLPLDTSTMNVVWTFADAAHGYAVSKGKWMTHSDHGETWLPSTSQSSDLIGVRLLDFSGAQTGMAISDNVLLKTTNGGQTWTKINPVVVK